MSYSNGNWWKKASTLPSSIVKFAARYNPDKLQSVIDSIPDQARKNAAHSILSVIKDGHDRILLKSQGRVEFSNSMLALLNDAIAGKSSVNRVKNVMAKQTSNPYYAVMCEIYAKVWEAVREKIFPGMQPIGDDILKKVVESRRKQGEDNDVLDVIPQLGVDPSRKAFFTNVVVWIVDDIRNSDINGAEDKFQRMSQIAMMDIDAKASRDPASAYNEANAFSTLAKKLSNIVSSKSLSSQVISHKQFDDKANGLSGKASQAAVPQQLTQSGSPKDLIAASLEGGFDEYVNSQFTEINKQASLSSVTVGDFSKIFIGVRGHMKDAFNASFNQMEYDTYASKMSKISPNGTQNQYSPVSEAKAIGKASAAFAMGCYVVMKSKGNSHFTAGIDDFKKRMTTAAKKMTNASYVVGKRYPDTFMNLTNTGLDPDAITAFSGTVDISSLSPALRQYRYKEFYRKFREQFEKRYNPGGMISAVFRKYPTVLTPYLDAPYMVAEMVVHVGEKMSKKQKVTDEERAFFFQYFVRKGNPEPTIGLANAGFVGEVVGGELSRFESDHNHLMIDKDKLKNDPTANAAFSASEKRAVEELVNRLVGHVVEAAGSAPIKKEHPPVVKADTLGRGLSSRAANTIAEGAGQKGQPTTPPITNPQDLPPVPDIPNVVKDRIPDATQPQGGSDGSEEAASSESPEQDITQGSVFYAFCCGIMTAHRLSVHVTDVAAPESGIKIVEDQALRLKE